MIMLHALTCWLPTVKEKSILAWGLASPRRDVSCTQKSADKSALSSSNSGRRAVCTSSSLMPARGRGYSEQIPAINLAENR